MHINLQGLQNHEHSTHTAHKQGFNNQIKFNKVQLKEKVILKSFFDRRRGENEIFREAWADSEHTIKSKG